MAGMIFDFNGTLFQDYDKHLAAWKVFAREKFGRELILSEYEKNFHGRSNRYAIEYLSETLLSEAETASLSEEKEAIYRELCLSDRESLSLAPGASDLFDFLTERDIPRTIATASCLANVNFYVERFGLGRWFDAAKIVFDDGLIPGKPEPDFYIRAALMIGVPASVCVAAEDSRSGVIAAHSAGMGKIFALAAPGRKKDLEAMPEVYRVIENFEELDRNLFTD
jgi:beta-phosphoglucomutase-like phosphatase (HAD superfamily)